MLGHIFTAQQQQQQQQRLNHLLGSINEHNNTTNNKNSLPRIDLEKVFGQRSACTNLSSLSNSKSNPSLACVIDSVWDGSDFMSNLNSELPNTYDKPDQEFGLETHNSPPLPSLKEEEPAIPKKQPPPGWKMMEKFPPDKVTDFKHVIYNLLVDNHNQLGESSFIRPCIIEENGVMRTGFCFNEGTNPEKKLPELYAKHIRKCRLDLEDDSSILIQDLYKYYMRACVELLSKYFEKLDKYTYLDDDVQLFIANGSLEDAEKRIKNMPTRSRKKKRKLQ